MAKKQPVDNLHRLAVALLVAAVSMLPLLHAGPVHAQADGCGAVGQGCTVDVCGCCDHAAEAQACCPSEGAPATDQNSTDPVRPADSPCDCTCCGTVMTVAPMAPPMVPPGLFWDQTPTALLIPHLACPDSVAVRVAIQPPIA
jgi:hypothetical protein